MPPSSVLVWPVRPALLLPAGKKKIELTLRERPFWKHNGLCFGPKWLPWLNGQWESVLQVSAKVNKWYENGRRFHGDKRKMKILILLWSHLDVKMDAGSGMYFYDHVQIWWNDKELFSVKNNKSNITIYICTDSSQLVTFNRMLFFFFL